MNNISPCWCCIYEKYKLKLFVVVLVIIHTSTSVAGDCKISNKLLAFFNVKDGIYLTFAHAVNSQSKLRLALDDPSIMILEADILMDPVKNIPIMAHPPATSSDLTLSQFLSKVLASKSARGMKLDFKQIEVVEPSLKIFKKALADAKLSSGKLAPIMLNADILAGPNDPQKVPVKATSFISHCKSDDSSILSTGWTTSKENSKSEGYTWKNVEEMKQVLKDVRQPVTFPVRAYLVGRSKEQLLWLLKQKKNYSLTIWHSYVDKYDVKEIAFLREYPCRVYYDLPDSMMKELRNIPSG